MVSQQSNPFSQAEIRSLKSTHNIQALNNLTTLLLNNLVFIQQPILKLNTQVDDIK